MHQRSDAAHLRILDAAAALTERAGLPNARETLAAARDRDPAISRMQEREAIADLLEGLVGAKAQPWASDGTASRGQLRVKLEAEPEAPKPPAEVTRAAEAVNAPQKRGPGRPKARG